MLELRVGGGRKMAGRERSDSVNSIGSIGSVREVKKRGRGEGERRRGDRRIQEKHKDHQRRRGKEKRIERN